MSAPADPNPWTSPVVDAVEVQAGREPSNFNVPNVLSTARIGLAVAAIGLAANGKIWYALGFFVVASVTDFVDGAWARATGQITRLGRIIDPFADKLLICGLLIQMLSIRELPLPPWAVIVVVARELFVTTLRSFVEGRGGDFSANLLGKLKMVLQCAVVIVGLFLTRAVVPIKIDRPEWPLLAFSYLVYAMVAVTALSGLLYFLKAWPGIVGRPEPATPPSEPAR